MKELTREALSQGEPPQDMSWRPVIRSDYIIGSVISIEVECATQFGTKPLVKVLVKEGASEGQPLPAGEIYSIWGSQMNLKTQLETMDIQPKDDIGIFFNRQDKKKKLFFVDIAQNEEARKGREISQEGVEALARDAEHRQKRLDKEQEKIANQPEMTDETVKMIDDNEVEIEAPIS